jgi:nucleoid-associated protein YgaU
VRDFLKIMNTTKPHEFVLFDHNPERLNVKRGLKGEGTTTPAAITTEGAGVQNRGTNPTELTITNARIVGPETKRYCDVMLAWMNAEDTLLTTSRLAGKRMPVLLVQWGPPGAGFTMKAMLTMVSINYDRISSVGVPVVAVVTMKLKEDPEVWSLTNPTSGGRPGRRRHVVVADETLMSIASAKFGDPSAWRAIAQVNRIDDPARVRPGDVMYLPADDELKSVAEASR